MCERARIIPGILRPAVSSELEAKALEGLVPVPQKYDRDALQVWYAYVSASRR